MNWTHEETLDARVRARKADREQSGSLSHAATLAIMDYAAELLAARGGTMTDERLRDWFMDRDHLLLTRAQVADLRQHMAAQGAGVATLREKVAALEHQNASLFKTASDRGHKIDALERHPSVLEGDLRATRAEAVRRTKERDALREKVAALEAELGEWKRGSEVSWNEITALTRERDALRSELARLNEESWAKPSGQVAEDVKTIRWIFDVAKARDVEPRAKTVNLKFTVLTLRGWIERAADALSRLAALAQQGQEAQKTLEAIRSASKPLVAGVRALVNGDAETPDCEICVALGTAHVLTMGAARRWLAAMGVAAEEAEPKPAPVDNAPWRCRAGTCGHAEHTKPRCDAFTHGRACPLPRGHEGEHERWATPGQLATPRDAAQVAERSQAFNEAATDPQSLGNGYVRVNDTAALFGAQHSRPDDHPTTVARREGFNEGAEAMRTACWAAVQGVLGRYGMRSSGLFSDVKAAIEGAAP